MKTYKLIDFVPKKHGGVFFWLGFFLLAVAAADQFYFHLLGSLTLLVWGLAGLFILLSTLLSVLPSSSRSFQVQVAEDGIIVNYDQYELPIPYEDMQTLTGGKVSQHHSLKNLSAPERAAVKPYFNQTQVFIELLEETEEFKQAKEHMPSFMFGTKQVGLLLLVKGDWIPVERAIDEARVAWMRQLKIELEKKHRPKSDAWYDQDDFDDEDDEWEV